MAGGRSMTVQKRCVAVDLGAESGRVVGRHSLNERSHNQLFPLDHPAWK
jgi:hypothetical protein